MTCKTTIGDRVKLRKNNLVGTVRFIGEIEGKQGIWYGIELDSAKGENMGNFKRTTYFITKRNKGLFIKKRQILKTNKKHNNALRVTVGDIVKVNAFKCNAIIRFIGTTDFKSGILYGIQLEINKGSNNGTVKNRQYFICEKNYGVFVRDKGIKIIKKKKRPEVIERDKHKFNDISFYKNNPALIKEEIILYPMVKWKQTVNKYNYNYSEGLQINFNESHSKINHIYDANFNIKQLSSFFLESQQIYRHELEQLFKPYFDAAIILDIILSFHGPHLLPIRYSIHLLPYFHSKIRHTKQREKIWNEAIKNEKTGQCTLDFQPNPDINVMEDIYYEWKSHIKNQFDLRGEFKEEAMFYIPDSNVFITMNTLEDESQIINQTKNEFTRLYVESLRTYNKCKEYAFGIDLVGINYLCYTSKYSHQRYSSGGWGSRSRCWDGQGLVLLNNGRKKKIKHLCVGDQVTVLNSLPYGVVTGFETATVKVKIQSVVNRKYEMVYVNDRLWITPYHAVLDTKANEWKMPCDLNKIQYRYVTSIFNFILDGGHVLCVNGVWANTLGHDLRGDVIEHPIWGNSQIMHQMWSKMDGYPNVVEYI